MQAGASGAGVRYPSRLAWLPRRTSPQSPVSKKAGDFRNFFREMMKTFARPCQPEPARLAVPSGHARSTLGQFHRKHNGCGGSPRMEIAVMSRMKLAFAKSRNGLVACRRENMTVGGGLAHLSEADKSASYKVI